MEEAKVKSDEIRLTNDEQSSRGMSTAKHAEQNEHVAGHKHDAHDKGVDVPCKKCEEMLNLAKYKAAELENYVKRNKDAVSNSFNDGRIQVVTSFLPIYDSLVEALKTMKDPTAHEGIHILQRKFEGILKSIGVEEIPAAKGDPFDPYVHQCVMASENTENKITEVWQKGYKFAGRVIRPVTVKI